MHLEFLQKNQKKIVTIVIQNVEICQTRTVFFNKKLLDISYVNWDLRSDHLVMLTKLDKTFLIKFTLTLFRHHKSNCNLAIDSWNLEK